MDCVFFQGWRLSLIKKDLRLGFTLEFGISKLREKSLKERMKERRKSKRMEKCFFELEVRSKEGFGLKLQDEGFGEAIKHQEVRDGPKRRWPCNGL